MNPPSRQQIEAAVRALEWGADLEDVTVLHATVVGSFGRDHWTKGDDVDIRVVYVLPTERYLTIGSFVDEIELLSNVEGSELDVVAFEVEKIARLILKGHRPTLLWLIGTPLFSVGESLVLSELAQARLEQLGDEGDRPRSSPSNTLYEKLDQLVLRARLGRVVSP